MRRRWLILAICLPLAIVWGVWRFHYQGADPRFILWPRDREAGAAAVLDALAELHVEDVLLRDALEQVEDRYGIEVEIEDAVLEGEGIPPNPPVSLDAEQLTLRTLLELLVRQADDRLVVGERGDRLLVTTRSNWRGTLNNYVTRVHRLDGLLGGADGRLNEQMLAAVVGSFPGTDSNPALGGSVPVGAPHSEIQILPGALLIKQLPEAHREIAALLDGLAQMQRQRREPLTVGVPAAARAGNAKVYRALGEPSSLDVDGEPLAVALDSLSRRHGIPICIDQAALRAVGIDAEALRTHRADSTRLDLLLDRMLNRVGLRFVVRDEAIVVTGMKKNMPSAIRLYPVADLLAGVDPDALTEALGYSENPVGRKLTCIDATLIVRQTNGDRGAGDAGQKSGRRAYAGGRAADVSGQAAERTFAVRHVMGKGSA